MPQGSLSTLGEKIGDQEDPEAMLRSIFKFINLKPANIDIYFLLLHKEKPLTVTELCRELKYSERTIRKYLQLLLKGGYIRRASVVRQRPCFAYSAVSPKKVWSNLVNQVRQIRIKAGKQIAKYKG